MRIIELNKRLYTVPENWNELTGRQLLAVMEVLYGAYPVNAAQLKLLKILTGISWYRFFLCPLAERADFLYLTHFLVNENNLTKQLLPEYRGMFGPDDDFNNITGEEFVFSEDFYFKCFAQTEEDNIRVMDEAAINNLVAVLYRPMKKGYDKKKNADGDPRVAFNQNVCAYHARRTIRKWPLEARLAIFTWYEACRKKMIESNPDIFSGGSGETAKYGLISVMRVIAEGGIHGTFEQVQKMFVQMWMVELNEKAAEAKRAEQNSK